MTPDISTIAVRQLHDYDARTPGTIFAEGLSLTIEQAYAIQTEVCRLREQRGEAMIGYKIGCTSPTIRQQLGIDHSVFGRLFAGERQESGSQLTLKGFSHLAIEGELSVRLSEDLSSRCADRDRILGCMEHVFPVIELHNHVLRSSDCPAAELIANNAIHAGIVVPREPLGLPSSDDLQMQISLSGETIAEVAYSGWKDRVVGAIAELSSLLASHELSLKAGQLVLTGSLAELIPVDHDARVDVTTFDHGQVSAMFVA